jgi:hypothetical protein
MSAAQGVSGGADRPVRLPAVGDQHAGEEREDSHVGDCFCAPLLMTVEEGEQVGAGPPRRSSARLIGVELVGGL